MLSELNNKCNLIKFSFLSIIFQVKSKWVLLNRAPTSTHLISASTQLSATPSTIFEPKYCTYLGSFPKFRPKSCPFWLRIGTHGILEVLIPNPGLGFWNCNPKTHFWANLGPKVQSCPFCLKIGARSIS